MRRFAEPIECIAAGNLARRFAALAVCCLLSGCQFLPQAGHKPAVFNPYPQLSRVAVAPFFNLSTEPTVDGRQFALHYYNELQSVPGFEVAPIGVVEETMKARQLDLTSPRDAQKLAQALGVDAVVVGAVTDYSAYYPPRCALRVEWYAANPCYHPIPAGYGLPWGEPAEEQIPERLVFEAEMAKAKAAMQQPPAALGQAEMLSPEQARQRRAQDGVQLLSAEQPLPVPSSPLPPGALAGSTDMTVLIPPDPCAAGGCQPGEEPVLRHTKGYDGADAEFTAALKNYVFVHDDARFGGWQSYLQRSDDFIRFCCHLHVYELLSARGGAAETRVVWRWPSDR